MKKEEIWFNTKQAKISKETEEKINNKAKILLDNLKQFIGDKNER